MANSLDGEQVVQDSDDIDDEDTIIVEDSHLMTDNSPAVYINAKSTSRRTSPQYFEQSHHDHGDEQIDFDQETQL